MILKQSFEDLLTNKINLNKTRIDKAIIAHEGVREYLKNHEEVKKYFYDSYLHGSYAQKTAIKPVNDNDYDVDVVITLDWKNSNNEFKDTTKLKQLIYSALEDNGNYKKHLVSHHGKKCISLEYSEYHLDILPAHSDQDESTEIWIIDNKNNWRKSNPKNFSQWCIDINKETKNIFKKVVKIMKYWRNIQFGEHHTPKSIVLTVILGNNISDSNISTDRTLVETLEKIVNKYDIAEDEVPEIINPSLTSENLSRNWKLEDYNRFIMKIKEAAIISRKALDEKTDIQKAIDLWNSPELFDNNLPKTSLNDQAEINEAVRFNTLQQSDKLFISSSGVLSDTIIGSKSGVPKARSWGY